MSLGSLVQLPVGGDDSQEGVLGVEGAGWGEQLSDWPGLQSESSHPKGHFWPHRTQETSELASKGHEDTSPIR